VGVNWDVVPGAAFATAAEFLASMLPDATVLRVAVAYVTAGGIAELSGIQSSVGAPPSRPAARADQSCATPWATDAPTDSRSARSPR
jgi:hypothetical protein